MDVLDILVGRLIDSLIGYRFITSGGKYFFYVLDENMLNNIEIKTTETTKD